MCAKSTCRLALAAAAAQDMAGFCTDLALDDLEEDDPLVLLAFLTVVVVVGLLMMDVFEAFGADTCVGVDVDDDDDDDEADDVQWTGGLGKAVGAGAS